MEDKALREEIAEQYAAYNQEPIFPPYLDALTAVITRRTQAAANIKTPCPACKRTALIIDGSGYLVCGNLECKDPSAIDRAGDTQAVEVAARIEQIDKIIEGLAGSKAGSNALAKALIVDLVNHKKKLKAARPGSEEEG